MPDPKRIKKAQRLSRPDRIIQFIERKNCPLWHPWEKSLDGSFCRFVEVTVQKEEADHEMRMALQELRDGLCQIPLYQLHFWNMSEEAIMVILLDKL